MKPFEEQFTAWVDGRLDAQESAEVEKLLEARPELLAERESTLKLGNLLREHGAAPALSNGDFFNSSILQQIESTATLAGIREHSRAWWKLPRLAWSGLGFVAAALVLFVTIIPHGSGHRGYVAQILKARAGDKGLSATAVYSSENKLTVLWLDGDADAGDAPQPTPNSNIP